MPDKTLGFVANKTEAFIGTHNEGMQKLGLIY